MPEQLLGRSGKGFSHVIHVSPGIDAPTSLEDSPPLSRPQLLPSGKGMGNPSCCVSSISAGASPGAPMHPRGFPTLLQRPSQENTNRGIISVPLPRTQFLFINGFLYFTEHLMENRRIKQATGTTRPSPCWPGLHNKQLCQPRQHLKPKAEPSPRHFQLELLALL